MSRLELFRRCCSIRNSQISPRLFRGTPETNRQNMQNNKYIHSKLLLILADTDFHLPINCLSIYKHSYCSDNCVQSNIVIFQRPLHSHNEILCILLHLPSLTNTDILVLIISHATSMHWVFFVAPFLCDSQLL